jgi:NAD(P)-dependent dehydrogenase (short-subunit alcohol dehydrogenase family)
MPTQVMTQSDFRNKTILVTGSGTGMGAATALLLAQRGANVTLLGRNEPTLRNVESAILDAGSKALVVVGDVTDPSVMEHAVATTVETFGALHGAVNNAGISSENHDLHDLPIEVWDTTVATNLSSLFFSMRAELPAIHRSGGGAIVNISSVFADRGMAQRAAYSASKHGIRGLTRSAARDWASRGVRVNELQPGVIQTPMLEGTPEEVAHIAASIPAGRIGRPEEIARVVAFLLSDESSYVIGAHLAVDGGFLD